MRQKIVGAIMAYAVTEHPCECCGIVVQKSRVQRYIPYRNLVTDPAEYLHLSPEDYAAAEDWGTVVAAVHNHPDTTTQASELDKTQYGTTLLPWHIVSQSEGNLCTIQPRGELPLLERPFVLGHFDCWGLVMGYFQQTHGIELTNYRVNYSWREDSYPENFYHDYWCEYEFREFSGTSQPGDMVIMQVQANKWNHTGILLEGDMLLHHLYDHLSQRAPYGGYQQERAIEVPRHKRLYQSFALSKGDRNMKKNISLISLLGLLGCSVSFLQEGQPIYPGHTSKSATQLSKCMSPE